MVRLFDDRLSTHHYDTKNEISAVEKKKDLQEGDRKEKRTSAKTIINWWK
jgi:hypothetical protein